MIDKGKHNLLGVQIDAVDYETAVSKIISAAKKRQAFTVSALAVHGVMTGVLDPVHLYRLNNLDLVVPDGQPVRWGLNLLHRAALTDRVYGPELTVRVCQRAAQENLPVFLFGSKLEILEKLSKNLRARFPNLKIAGMMPSKFRQISAHEKVEVVKTIRASKARLILVGLGCPRQEVWVYEHRLQLSMPMLAVGAAFDFHAKTVSQAPLQLQKYGLEWLYRFSREPSRLWKRYLLLNPYYLWLLFLQRIQGRHFQSITPEIPTQEIRYG